MKLGLVSVNNDSFGVIVVVVRVIFRLPPPLPLPPRIMSNSITAVLAVALVICVDASRPPLPF